MNIEYPLQQQRQLKLQPLGRGKRVPLIKAYDLISALQYGILVQEHGFGYLRGRTVVLQQRAERLLQICIVGSS